MLLYIRISVYSIILAILLLCVGFVFISTGFAPWVFRFGRGRKYRGEILQIDEENQRLLVRYTRKRTSQFGYYSGYFEVNRTIPVGSAVLVTIDPNGQIDQFEMDSAFKSRFAKMGWRDWLSVVIGLVIVAAGIGLLILRF